MKLIIYYFVLFFAFLGCSKKSDSILTTRVQKDSGNLSVINESSFLGATVAGTSIDYNLIIKASGGLSISDLEAEIITNDPISFKGGQYPGTGGDCGSALGSGETCTIVLEYKPENTASHAATINFKYKDALKSYEKIFQVSADSHPILSFEYGTLYDFGNKFVGSSTDLRIRISNTGKVVAQNITINNLSHPFSMKGGSYPGIGGTCGSSLSPGQTCDLYVNYSPTTNGEHVQGITLRYMNTGRPEDNTLHMMAWGFYEAQLNVSDTTGYNFGTVAAGVIHDKTFTITHSGGDVTATSIDVTGLSSPFSYKGGSFPGTGGTCQRTLSKEKGSCTVVISLNTALSGNWNNTLTFHYFNGKQEITLQRPISAQTKQRAQISITPTSHNFGVTQYDTQKVQTFTITYISGEIAASNFSFTSFANYFGYAGGSYPGTGGTCGASLSSGSCTITLSYFPKAYNTHTNSPVFSYHDGTGTKTLSLSLQGKTNSNMTNTGSGAFGNVVNGQTKTATLTIRASAGNGITNLQIASIPSPFTRSGGTCTTTIAAGGSCTMVISFSPQTEGTHSGTLIISYDGGTGSATHSIALTGTSTPAANLTIADTDFGTTSVNSTKEMFVNITNTSTISPTVINWNFPEGYSFKGGSFPGTGGNCWSSNCRIVVVFNPTQAKTYTGTLTLNYNDGAGNTKQATATLTGVGIPSNDLFISDFNTVNYNATYNPIYVGQEREISFTLSHGGGVIAATIHSKTLANNTDYSIVDDNCPGTLSNGASCTFKVRFAPQSSGTKASSFTVSYTSDAAKSSSRSITGTATLPAIINPSMSSIDFGSKSTDSYYDLTLTFTNSGGRNGTLFTRNLAGSGFSVFSDNCPATMTYPLSCTMVLRFTPTNNTTYNGSITYSYNNSFKTVTTVIPITGIGAPTAKLNFSAATYDFGDIIQTQVSSRTIIVNHSGPVPATNMASSTLSAPYRYKGGKFPGEDGTCTDTLTSGSCTLVIEFAPTTTGVKNHNLTLDYFNGNDNRTINTLLTGEGLAQAIISISENNPYDFGSTNVGGMIDKTFTLSNSGSVAGTDLVGSFDIGVFTFKGGSFPGVGGSCTTTLAAGANCTIVISFTPSAISDYSGTLTLNYHDGLRTQTEMKDLKGKGINAFMSEHYLSQLSEASLVEMEQLVSIENDDLEGLISTKEIKILKNNDTLFSENNHLFPLIEGLYIKRLKEDFNLDGINDFLFSIQNEKGEVIGYSIRCGSSGRIVERFLSPI